MFIKIAPAYGGVCFLATFTVGQYLVYTDLERIQRQSTFDSDVINFAFNEIHKKEVGDDPASQGYPDDGNGRYISSRTYGDWYFLNITKRQKLNNLDNLVMVAPLSLANGAFLPIPTMAMQLTYLFGRYNYNMGYNEKEGVLN